MEMLTTTASLIEVLDQKMLRYPLTPIHTYGNYSLTETHGTGGREQEQRT